MPLLDHFRPPLWLEEDVVVALNLEASYAETLASPRIAG